MRKATTYFTPEDIRTELNSRACEVDQQLNIKIENTLYPCLGAKAALNTSQYRIGIYDKMASEGSTDHLAEDLKLYIQDTLSSDSKYMSMIAVFTDEPCSETEFEVKLWTQLQKLHDHENGVPWDPSVTSDPDDENFSFSFHNNAFFIVGLHPNASRKSRNFSFTAMAFNLHSQFEKLRHDGIYERMKHAIREREISYEGSINPMLTDHGDGLEAPQYSGRQVDSSWKCPFHKH